MTLPPVIRASLGLLCATALSASVAQDARAQNAPTRAARAQVATRAEASTPAAEALLASALATAARGDTTEALELLEQANRLAKKDPEVLFWRGLMLSRTTALSFDDVPRNLLAWHLLSNANDIDPTNPRYLLEMGRVRLRMPLMRLEATRLFGKALDVAETRREPALYAEIAYEIGQIQHRRYGTARDRWLYTSDILFDPNFAFSRRHYTREFLESKAQPVRDAGINERSESGEYYRRALSVMPAYEPAAIALMALLHDERRFEEMLTTAQATIAAGGDGPRVRMSAGLASYRLGRLAESTRHFESGLARMTPELRAEWLDIGRIIREGDSVRIAGSSPRDRAAAIAAFWEGADPLLETKENEGYLEYLSRMTLADLQYTDTDMRQVGWRTDRGTVLVRYGEPPVVAVFPPAMNIRARDAMGHLITVWFYPRTELQYVFMSPPAMNRAMFAGDFRDFTEAQRESGPFLLDNLGLAMAVDTVPMQIARLRNAAGTGSRLYIAADVPTRELYKGAEIDRGQLDVTFYAGSAGSMTRRRQDTVNVTLPGPSRTTMVYDTPVTPEGLRVRVEARDRSITSAAGRSQITLDAFAPTTKPLDISDIIVGNPTPAKEGLRSLDEAGLSPRGDLRFAPRDTFSLYWESYGLQPTADGRVQSEIHLSVTLVEIDRGPNTMSQIFGSVADGLRLSREGETTLGLRYESNEALAGRDRVPGLVTISLGSAPPGRYRLQLAVTDKTSKRTAITQRDIRIRRTQ